MSFGLLIILLIKVFNVVNVQVIEFNLINRSRVWFSFLFIYDLIRVSFRFVVITISSCVFSFACAYIRDDPFKFRFVLILILFVLSINILIFSGSLFFLLLGWDGLGISSFALIIYYSRASRLQAGFLTLITNRLGDVLIILSIPLLLYRGRLGIYSFYKFVLIIRFLLCLAALTKRAQYPFRAWLPAAIAAPTPVRALVHSSTLVTAGVYLVIRLRINLNLRDLTYNILLFCGSLTCILGGICATYENDIKKIIAFSTLRQLGLIIFRLGLAQPQIALLHLFTHAIFKALLFIRAGLILIMGFGSQDIRLLGSILSKTPALVVFFNIRSICLMGAPFVRAFYSKHVIYELIIQSNLNILRVLLIFLGAFLTRLYSIRLIKALSWYKISFSSIRINLSIFSYLPLIILFIFSVIRGKIFTIIDIRFNRVIFISRIYQIILNSLIFLGVTFGFILVGPKKNLFRSSIIYLWPGSNNIGILIQPFLKNIVYLDQGWLEPSNYTKNKILFWSTIPFLNNRRFYKLQLSISQGFLLGIIFYIWYII